MAASKPSRTTGGKHKQEAADTLPGQSEELLSPERSISAKQEPIYNPMKVIQQLITPLTYMRCILKKFSH